MNRLSGLGLHRLCAALVWVCLSVMGLSSQAAAAPGVTAGNGFTVALKTDGSVWAWGDYFYGQFVGESACSISNNWSPKLFSTGFASVSAGLYHTVAIKTDGSLWGWGRNSRGQLSDAVIYGYAGSCTPQQIGSGFASVSAGSEHTVAIKTDGSLWAWGWDLFGQLGDGIAPDYYVDVITSNPTPQQIGIGFASVAAGANHTVAIKTDGSLWAWGDNSYGQLGDGTIAPMTSGVNQNPTPKQIGIGFASVFAGPTGAFAIKTDGSLWAWGDNTYGQLGDGTTTNSLIPKQIGIGFASVAMAYFYTFAIKTDGSLWAWGYNRFGQFGDGTTIDALTPKQIGTGFFKVAVSKNSSYTESVVAIKTDGSLWAWGDNSIGQIGDGTLSGGLTPKQIFADGFEMSLLSVTTTQPQVSSPQLITAQLTLTNDQNTSLTFTPYLLEKDGIQYAPDAADAANAVYEAPAADNTLKVKLAPVILAARETRTLDIPIVIARPDLTDPAVATAMTVDFGVTTSDNRDITATLNLNVSPRSEPAPASALLQSLRTGPVADLGVISASAALGVSRAISTELPSANGDYWNLWVLVEMDKKPKDDEDRKFYRKLLRFGLSAREAYAVLYLRAIANLKPEKAGKTGWFKLAKGSAQLWAEVKKGQWGLTPDFNTPARSILEGLDSVNALYFLNLLELSGSYSAPLVNAMSDNFAAFASTYTRTSQALCDYVQNGTLVSLPFPRMVEADLAYYMTSNGRWHPKIHNVLFDRVSVKGQDGQPQTLSRFLEDFMVAYPQGDVPGCPIGGGQRNWVRIDVHSPLLPMVTDSQGRRFGIDASGILHEEIPHAYIDPGHPWSMAVSVPDGALTIDYALAYPFDYGIEVNGLFDGIVTSKHVTQGTATAGFSLKQQATVSNTAQGTTITPIAANDAPTASDATLTMAANSSYTLQAGDFGFLDVEDGTALTAVRIDSLPASGSLRYGAAAMTAGLDVSAAELAAGNLTFTSTSTASGTYYASFRFSVKDSGGAYASSANTLTFNIGSCTYALSSSSQTASAAGLSGNFSATTNTGCPWTATSNASWITVTSGSSGNGNGSVVYAVAANTSSSARTGTLTIGGQTFTVTQAGASVASPGTWTALPGASPSRPSLALNAATGKTQMVVRSVSDQLYVGNFNSGGTFEGWNALPGASPSVVAQAWHPVLNKMFMVVRAAGDQLYLGTFSSAGSFEGWSALSGASPSPVALAWHATLNKMFMVVRAANDQLYLGTFNSAGSFEGWSALSGASPSPVALAWHSTLNKMFMVARAANDQLYLGTFGSAGSFEGWSALSGASPSPVALAWHPASSKMVMAVRGADDQLWQGTFGSTSGVFEGWSALSGSSPTPPVLATGQSNLQLVVRSTDDQLWSLLVE